MRFRNPGSDHQDLFGQLEHAQRLASNTRPLDKLAATIDFEFFRETLLDLLGYRDRVDKGGNAPFDPVFMLKVIVLQKFYDLSDPAVAYEITNRFDFMRFLGIAPGDDTPDQNTVWDFKEKLGNEGIGALFELLDARLSEQGVVGKSGVSVDASFVDAPRQRNSRKENAAIKQGELPEGWENDSAHRLRQKDLDARWTKKNNETHYGYKNHIKMDHETKLIRNWLVSPANEHDSLCFLDLLEKGDLSVHADSAYRSKIIMKTLRQLKIKAFICQKGQKDKPLSAAQKRANRKKAKVRARVEHVFAAMAQMGTDQLRTIGIFRAVRSIGLANLTYNLRRCSQLGVSIG